MNDAPPPPPPPLFPSSVGAPRNYKRGSFDWRGEERGKGKEGRSRFCPIPSSLENISVGGQLCSFLRIERIPYNEEILKNSYLYPARFPLSNVLLSKPW